MKLWNVPLQRPVATTMVFVGVVLVGLIAWRRIPVELLPPLSGDELFVQFSRPGSDPEVVEREILMPLESRSAELGGLIETWGEVAGASGSFRARFAPGTDVKVRELDLRRMAAHISRQQPKGTLIEVSSADLGELSRFVMYVQVTGMDDRHSLLDLVSDRIVPRLTAVSGVSQVIAGGGAPRELTVRIDADRCAAAGVLPDQVMSALAQSVQRLRYLGGAEDEAGRTAIVLDGRPGGIASMGNLRIDLERDVLLRHVAEVELGLGREETIFRVNGQPTVAMVIFQSEGANLVRLGRQVRNRLETLRQEFRPYGLDFIISFDAADMVEEQLGRLQQLALSGFLIGLVVLYLFLRQWRAVAVVALAVPTSLLSAMAMLFLGGQSINLVTLFGLAVGIGMLVDNSIVVYEAIQRRLEHGATPARAAELGVRRTVRAIIGSTICNAIVFLPIVFIDFEETFIREFLKVMALAMLLPQAGSLLVAIGLVPMLARNLAAPAALAHLEQKRRRRQEMGGLSPPDRLREMFSGLITVILRRPGGWLTAVTAAVLLTVAIALPRLAWTTATQEPAEAESIRFTVEMAASGSLERAQEVFGRLERQVEDLDGIERVESLVREDSGALTVHLLPKAERPKDMGVGRVRELLRAAAEEMTDLGVELELDQAGGGGGGPGGGLNAMLAQKPAAAMISGPDARQLDLLARELEAQLESIHEVASANVESRKAQDEIRVLPDPRLLQSYGLTADQVLPILNVLRREGMELRTGFVLPDGREIPLTIRRGSELRRASQDLARLRLATPSGVLPIEAVAEVRKMPPPSVLLHHDGRREISVTYQLSSSAPTGGASRKALEEQIRSEIQQLHHPTGYAVETPEPEAGFNWFRSILVPVILLLYAVLAVTFESLTLPLLVLVSLPLTLLGATWALVLAGMPLDAMVLVGALTLIGMTVNPAILLVDRMQQRAWQGDLTAGAAALLAVRERARPVLMTTITAVVGLWPLALTTGKENEIWPPFSTVVIGGMITSTLLTLLVVPVGFVLLHRLDRLFGRLGPWVVLGWCAATAVVMTPLVRGGVITSLTWQLVTTVLVASLLLGLAVLLFRRPESPQPLLENGTPVVRLRYLRKVYGLPGPVGRAWRAHERFAQRVLERGGRAFHPREALEGIPPRLLVLAGTLYLGLTLQTVFWRLVFLFASAVAAGLLLREIRRARGKADRLGRVHPGGIEGVAAALAPWAAYAWAASEFYFFAAGGRPELPAWLLGVIAPLVAVIQLGRHTAVRLARGDLGERVEQGWLKYPRSLWRRSARRLFGLDLPREQVRALSGVHLEARRGMIGVLGPNGAGKTTLLRLLAGILEPSTGKITLGGVPLEKLRRYLARYVGYLPQDFGLPDNLTAREYLDYFALLYEIQPQAARRERVQRLLEEVGLGERADERIGSYSGGMRQRVAVARTLLRLPPVIIVDEPTVGLDPRERIRFRNLLGRLAGGRVVFFSTHVVEDVAVACERVIVLARGRVVFDGVPADLSGQARGKVWEARLGADSEVALPAGALVVDQVPEGEGWVRNRILSFEPPLQGAQLAEPTLEDGYLWLVRGAAAA